jgi:hypothetical protein
VGKAWESFCAKVQGPLPAAYSVHCRPDAYGACRLVFISLSNLNQGHIHQVGKALKALSGISVPTVPTELACLCQSEHLREDTFVGHSMQWFEKRCRHFQTHAFNTASCLLTEQDA